MVEPLSQLAEPLKSCPICGVAPFRSCHWRGMVARSPWRWPKSYLNALIARTAWPRYAVFCNRCEGKAGYEDAYSGTFERIK